MNLLEEDGTNAFIDFLTRQDFFLWNWLWLVLALIVVIAIIVVICVAINIHVKINKEYYTKVDESEKPEKDKKDKKNKKNKGKTAPAKAQPQAAKAQPKPQPAPAPAPQPAPAPAPVPALRRNPNIEPGMSLILVEAAEGLKPEGDTFTIRADEPFNINKDIICTTEPGFNLAGWTIKSDGPAPVFNADGSITPEDDVTYTFCPQVEFVPQQQVMPGEAVICIPPVKGLAVNGPAQIKVPAGVTKDGPTQFDLNTIDVAADAGIIFMGWSVTAASGGTPVPVSADGKFTTVAGETYRVVGETAPDTSVPAPAPAEVSTQIRIALEPVAGITYAAGDAIYVNPGEKVNVNNIAYKLDTGCKLTSWTITSSHGRPEVDETGCFTAVEGKEYTITAAVNVPKGTVITDNAMIADKEKDILIPVDGTVGISVTDGTIISRHNNKVSTSDIAYTAESGYKLTGWTLYAGNRVRNLAPDATFTVVDGKDYRLVAVSKSLNEPGAGVTVERAPGIRIIGEDESVNIGGMFHISSIQFNLDRKFILKGWQLYVNGIQQGGLLTDVNSFKVQPGVAYKLVPEVEREAKATRAAAEPAAATEPAPAPAPAPAQETAPAPAPAAAAAPAKEVKKMEDKKTNAQPVEEETTEAAEAAEAAKKPATKVYHVSKRKADGKWQVKFANGQKAIKLFDTQLDAIDYAKKLAASQDGRIVIHKEDGSFRKLTYTKKQQ